MANSSDQLAVDYQLSADDLAHYFQHTMTTSPAVLRRRRLMHRVGAGVLATMVAYAMISQGGSLTERLTAGVATCVIFLVMFGLVWVVARAFDPRRRQLHDLLAQADDGWQSLTLDEAGIHFRQDDCRDTIDWSDIRRVDRDERLLYLYVTDMSAYIIPLAAFASVAEAEAFYETALRNVERTRVQ
jgi:hypothetical protein